MGHEELDVMVLQNLGSIRRPRLRLHVDGRPIIAIIGGPLVLHVSQASGLPDLMEGLVSVLHLLEEKTEKQELVPHVASQLHS